MKKIIINPENPNGIEVNMTAEEIAQREQDAIKAEQEKIAFEAKQQAKENAKVSGNQKLLDLGLTQAEATALTSYTPPVEE